MILLLLSRIDRYPYTGALHGVRRVTVSGNHVGKTTLPN